MSSLSFDCSKLLIPFLNCPKGTKLVDYFPELSAYEEFTQQQDENTIRIAILTSDADSPFWKLRGDREIMIKTIFEFLDIGMLNLMGQQLYQKVVDYKHEGVVKCWSAYLQMQYNIDFTDWAITKQTYDMLIGESTRQKEPEEKMEMYANWRVKIRGQIKNLGDELKKIEPLVFKDSKMAQPVAMEEVKKIKNYAEKYGRKFEGFNA